MRAQRLGAVTPFSFFFFSELQLEHAAFVAISYIGLLSDIISL